MIELPYLNDDTPFPAVSQALDEPNGLLAFGGSLDINRLFTAYSNGIFPWFSDDEPILWWSPSPRAIIPLDNFHCSTSLRKLARKAIYTVTLNHAFEQVVNACATIPRAHPGKAEMSSDTWITDDMIHAYTNLHQAGLAHSVEVWEESRLVGGLYGVAVGNVFCGESMFHYKSNTSKLAMLALVTHMKRHQLAFIDCQLPTEHLTSLGAIEVEREVFINRLAAHNHTVDGAGKLTEKYRKVWAAQDLTP